MTKFIRVHYEKGVLKPSEKLDLQEGEELTVVIKRRSFYEMARGLQAKTRKDLDKVLEEIRGCGKKLYG